MKDPRRLFAVALLAQLLGAAGALLFATRAWQSAVLHRERPLPPVDLDVTGRTIDALPTALALVALAGVVAVLATGGLVRRIVGALVALAGLGIVVVGVSRGFTELADSRIRSLASSHHNVILLGADSSVDVSLHAVWPALTAVCGGLILVAGVLTVAFGANWSAMSRRYQRGKGEGEPGGAEPAAPDSVQLWNSLDRGEDPTGAR